MEHRSKFGFNGLKLLVCFFIEHWSKSGELGRNKEILFKVQGNYITYRIHIEDEKWYMDSYFPQKWALFYDKVSLDFP